MQKHTPPRLSILLLCVVALLICSIIFVACDPKPAPDAQSKTFTVKIAEYDNTLGSVTVSAPKEGTLYQEGDTVTVKVAPQANCHVASFAVSGFADAKLDADNKYSFKIVADVTVTVAFERDAVLPEFTQEALDSLKGALKLEGTCSFTRTSQDAINDADLKYLIETTFTSDAYHNKEVLNSEAQEITAFKNSEGKPVSYYLKRDNTYGESQIINYDGENTQPTDWDIDFANPFDSLSVSDFSYDAASGDFVLNSAKTNHVAYTITRYIEAIDNFSVKVQNGVVSNIYFSFSDSESGVDTNCEYKFEVKAHGNDVTPPAKPSPMPTTENHAKLQAALDELASGNFTIERKVVEEGSEVSFKVYYADDAFFYNYKSNDPDDAILPQGAVVLEDGIYMFTYNEAENLLMKGDKVQESSIKAYNPHCNIAPALFEDKGNGLFVAYNIALQDVRNMTIAQVAATSLDNHSSIGNVATNIRIRLNEAMTHVQTITYDYWYMENWAGTVTLTYCDFDLTEVPLDLSTLKNEDKPSVELPGPEGTFTVTSVTGEVNVTEGTKVVITDTTIKIGDGEPITFTNDDGWELRFTYNGETLSASYYETMGWCIGKTNFSWYFYAKADGSAEGPSTPSVELPGPTGTFIVTSKYGEIDVTEGVTKVVITDTTIKIGDGEPITFDVGIRSLKFELNGHSVSADYYTESSEWFIMCNESDAFWYFYAKPEESSTPSSKLPGPTGTYTAVGYGSEPPVKTVVITETTISFDDEVMTFELVQTVNGYYLGFTYKGTKYTAMYTDATKTWTVMASDYSVMFTLQPQE